MGRNPQNWPLCVAIASILAAAQWPGCSKDASDAPVAVKEHEPPIASFAVTPSSGTVDTFFRFDASQSRDVVDGPPALEVRWDWENDGGWDTGYTPDKQATHRFSRAGSITVALEVKNTVGLTTSTTRTLEVQSGTPSVTLVVTPPMGGYLCTTFQASVTVIDLKNEYPDAVARVFWGDGTMTIVPKGEHDASHVYARAALYDIRAEAFDGHGVFAQSQVQSVHALENEPPLARLAVTRNQSCQVNFALTVTDCEHTPPLVLIRWDWQGDGAWDTGYRPVLDTVTLETWTYPATGPRILQPTVEVRDGENQPVTANTTVELKQCP